MKVKKSFHAVLPPLWRTNSTRKIDKLSQCKNTWRLSTDKDVNLSLEGYKRRDQSAKMIRSLLKSYFLLRRSPTCIKATQVELSDHSKHLGIALYI